MAEQGAKVGWGSSRIWSPMAIFETYVKAQARKTICSSISIVHETPVTFTGRLQSYGVPRHYCDESELI